MNKFRKVYILFILLSLILSFAQLSASDMMPTSGSFLPSLDWQKMALEKSIREKVVNSLSKIIKSKDYLVDIEINVNQPIKPRFTPPGASPDNNSGGKDKKSSVRISDISPDKLPKDYIIFSKLGLEAPLIDDFENFKNDSKGGSKGDKNKEKLPPFEQLWKFNKSLDIFNNLERVRIYVQLSERLHISTRESVSKILNSLNYNLNQISPELSISYINMQERFNTFIIPSNLSEFIDLVAKFSNMIGLILAVLLFGAIAFLLLKKWEKIEKDGAGTESSLTQSKDDEKDESMPELGQPSLPSDNSNSSQNIGIERFETFFKHNPTEAVILVKKWILDEGDIDKNALRALVQQLENEVLISLFERLSFEEREKWKSFLDKQVDGQELINANTFISNQIVQDILIPFAIEDSEVCDLLLKISPENAAAFVTEDPESGKILLNVMNTKFVSKILDHLEDKYIDYILTKSLEFSKDEISKLLNDLKNGLIKYQETKTQVPFLGKINELISLASPTRENSLYKVIAQSSENSEEISQVAIKYYPSVLIPQLPDNLLKNILSRYPMDKMLELVSSLDDSMREKFLEVFAPKGSKTADVLEIEMEKIESDLNFQKRVRQDSSEIWKHFVDFSRKYINSDNMNQTTYLNIVEQWAHKVQNGQDPSEAAAAVDPEATSIFENDAA